MICDTWASIDINDCSFFLFFIPIRTCSITLLWRKYVRYASSMSLTYIKQPLPVHSNEAGWKTFYPGMRHSTELLSHWLLNLLKNSVIEIISYFLSLIRAWSSHILLVRLSAFVYIILNENFVNRYLHE